MRSLIVAVLLLLLSFTLAHADDLGCRRADTSWVAYTLESPHLLEWEVLQLQLCVAGCLDRRGSFVGVIHGACRGRMRPPRQPCETELWEVSHCDF